MYYKNLNINGKNYPIAVNITGQGAPNVYDAASGMIYFDEVSKLFYVYTNNSSWELMNNVLPLLREINPAEVRSAGGYVIKAVRENNDSITHIMVSILNDRGEKDDTIKDFAMYADGPLEQTFLLVLKNDAPYGLSIDGPDCTMYKIDVLDVGNLWFEQGNGEASMIQKVADGETENKAEGKGAVTFGFGNVNNGQNVILFGQSCEATENAKSALCGGKESKVNHSYAVSLGRSCEANGYYSFAGNHANIVNGQAAVAFCDSNTVDGDYACAFNARNKAIGKGSAVFGAWNVVRGEYAAAIGNNLLVQYLNQFACGYYNKNRANTIFEIGNGLSDTSRSNAVEVYQDGRVKVYGDPVEPEDVLRKKDTFVFAPCKISMHDTQNGKAACSATGSAASALGEGLIAKRYGQTVVGTFNDDSNDGQTRFVVGGGTTDKRFNALMVYADGRSVAGRSTTNSDSGNTLVTKDYLLAKIAELEAKITQLTAN